MAIMTNFKPLLYSIIIEDKINDLQMTQNNLIVTM